MENRSYFHSVHTHLYRNHVPLAKSDEKSQKILNFRYFFRFFGYINIVPVTFLLPTAEKCSPTFISFKFICFESRTMTALKTYFLVYMQCTLYVR